MGGGNAALEALVSPVGGEPSRLQCRSCGQADLRQVLDLGRVPLANALLTSEKLSEPEDRFPLELYFCPQCALVQIGETVPPERLFRDYAYASSFSDTMVEHARTLVEAPDFGGWSSCVEASPSHRVASNEAGSPLAAAS